MVLNNHHKVCAGTTTDNHSICKNKRNQNNYSGSNSNSLPKEHVNVKIAQFTQDKELQQEEIISKDGCCIVEEEDDKMKQKQEERDWQGQIIHQLHPPLHQYQIEGSVRVRLQTSQMFKFVLICILILLGLGCLVFLRLNSLETRINNLQLELQEVKNMKSLSKEFITKLSKDEAESIEIQNNPEETVELPPNTRIELPIQTDELENKVSSIQQQRKKRDIFSDMTGKNSSATTNNSSESFENDNNSLATNSSIQSLIQLTSMKSSQISINNTGAVGGGARRGRARERGKTPSSATLLKRLEKVNLRRIVEKEKREKLKSKLLATRSRAANLATKLIAQRSDIRAVYLIPIGAHISIEELEQYIGPWHIAKNEKDIGFNGLWYNDIRLDSNGTSVVFIENGLYTITSQVLYHLSAVESDKSLPMGYKIYVKKAQPSKFHQPFSVAECVTSYPFTYYQTCLTSVTWYLEKGDEIFLKHFKNSLPIIESDEQGKTFLQIIKLGG